MSNELETTKELSIALTNMVNLLTDTANSVKGFALDNLPDVINQLITWSIVKSCIDIAIFSIIISVLIFMAVKMNEWRKEDRYNEWIAGVVLLPIFSLIFAIPVVTNIMELIKINIATKLWLLEYAANLAR